MRRPLAKNAVGKLIDSKRREWASFFHESGAILAEFIYQMIKARKAHGDKVILDDVTLAFFPGAKIGVVGPNGAGKSTVLKIMAGLDTPSNGEARLSPEHSVGILMQEPHLDETLTVLGNVELAVKETKAKLDRFNEISALMAEPDADFDALLAEMGTLQEQIDHLDAWDLDLVEQALRDLASSIEAARSAAVPVVLMEPPGLRLPSCGRAITLAAARRTMKSRVTLMARLAEGSVSL